MHMADALISPAVGAAMIAASVGIGGYAVTKMNQEMDDKKVPLMGVLGAFIFAAQMINFTIPGTGSSGHIGGGLLLAILLGPYAGFLSMASVLIIQALFFADGGLLALGCNIFNLGFFTCFIAYPFIYKPLILKGISRTKLLIGSILGVVFGLQLGSFSVVLQTIISGKTELPFKSFLYLMQPIHLGIGIIEGVITAAVILFIWNARPELLDITKAQHNRFSNKKVLVSLIFAAFLIGGFLSLYASENPDGLEWSIEGVMGTTDLDVNGKIYEKAQGFQDKLAFLPDYGFKNSDSDSSAELGTSFSGIIGGGMTLLFIALVGISISFFKKRRGLNNH